jgi:hypothetical protein
LIESSLVFIPTGANGSIDVADTSTDESESNDLYVDVEGYFIHTSATDTLFGTPYYLDSVNGDTFYNTEGTANDIISTANDSRGVNQSCTAKGSDIAIFDYTGDDPSTLVPTSVNCMLSYGPRAGGNEPDGCSWKSGGITRIGTTLYMSVARQLKACSYGLETNGLQPSFNASIVRSSDGGITWTNPWGLTSTNGAAPRWKSSQHAYQAMFPGQTFPAPFFIQYGPGNTQTVDGADKYLYAVSTDGYAYDGNYLHLARVPLDKIQTAGAWQFYHGRVGGAHASWTSSAAGATRVLQARHGLSQPAIQYVPALHEYVMTTFYYSLPGSDFPTLSQTPYTRFQIYTAPKPWGPWTHVFDHGTQRSIWCTTSPCEVLGTPGATAISVGSPDDWLGLYDPSLVQKFVYSLPMTEQALFVGGDWKHQSQFPGENLYRLHVLPFDLRAVLQ